MVAGVHFPLSTSAFDIGYKSLAVNLSDLGAMGATPLGAKLSLVAPSPPDAWLEAFQAGFMELARNFSLSVGGSKPRFGELVVTVQVYGAVPAGKSLLRSGAAPGDTILVTGTLGDAGAGLASVLGDLTLVESDRQILEQRLNRPSPRVKEGLLLRDWASGAIDVSDGLLADLGHLATASGIGARLDASLLPLSETLRHCFDLEEATRHALLSGDDYELLFTCPAGNVDGFLAEFDTLPTPCTVIGSMEPAPGVRVDGAELSPDSIAGWEHFT